MPEHNYIVKVEAGGSVNISEDVLATIAGEAVKEVEGVGGFSTSFGGEIADRFSKKNAPPRGVKLTIEENNITIDVFILVRYGNVISDVGRAVQEAVISGIEAMTGISVKAVNVTICGVAFEKSK